MLGFEPVLSPHHTGGWEHRQAGAWQSAQNWKVLFPLKGLSPCPSWMSVYKLPPGPNSNHSFKIPHWFSFPESWGSGIQQEEKRRESPGQLGFAGADPSHFDGARNREENLPGFSLASGSPTQRAEVTSTALPSPYASALAQCQPILFPVSP